MAPFRYQKYQASLTDEFSIGRADGQSIAAEMSGKISEIFRKNAAALKVRPARCIRVCKTDVSKQ